MQDGGGGDTEQGGDPQGVCVGCVCVGGGRAGVAGLSCTGVERGGVGAVRVVVRSMRVCAGSAVVNECSQQSWW